MPPFFMANDWKWTCLGDPSTLLVTSNAFKWQTFYIITCCFSFCAGTENRKKTKQKGIVRAFLTTQSGLGGGGIANLLKCF